MFHVGLMFCYVILQWAEVLSADAFSAFEDAGLDSEKVRLLLIVSSSVQCSYCCNSNL